MKLIHLSCLLGLSILAHAEAPKFELRDGDRVLLLGDALLERENTLGFLEARMHAAWPSTKFTVRNLSWAGDTPKGWSRASFDAPQKGYERLKEQIALVKPTVVFLGYGMAASLQEMTDRSNDIMLNRDTARYGEEPMTAARFKKELGELMTDIQSSTEDTKGTEKPSVNSVPSVDKKVRFVLLSPIRHEDLRKTRPGTMDPTKHNELLVQYSKSAEELAAERGTTFIDLKSVSGTQDGIHLTDKGNAALASVIFPKSPIPNPQSLAAILKKNDLFFHRTRPANSTYIFGFRKAEQGRNAVEIPQFDPLVDAVDAEIDALKRGGTGRVGVPPAGSGVSPELVSNDKAPAAKNASRDSQGPGGTPTLPIPNFTMEDGYEITLWADTNLVGKPVGMNWDAAGRLWVACSPVYPQIKPGAHPEDKVVVIEDTDRDGKADKSTTFATNLLIAAGVAPDFVAGPRDLKDKKDKKDSKDSKDGVPLVPLVPSPNAAYVGSSTELVHVTDTDGDGKADVRRVVLSGFGTEDTHHTIHTLKWGPDGRLYFNQSIYIHSHLETPYGMVRVNSGAIMAYDPRTERTEVIAKGWCNPWGHVWDEWGQSFTTDGAGGQGISWVVPGAMYFTYENAKKIMPSVSPGSYPKFCGLELVKSPLFPADWQGDAITCDFRAHRIARFSIKDLSEPTKDGKDGKDRKDGKDASLESLKSLSSLKSGYETKAEADLVRTTDASFRPIDVKLGPDGALYVADWTNPVINHGEVDFRDPRRDHVNGRIWRIAPKGKEPVKWESLVGAKSDTLIRSLQSQSEWALSKARDILNRYYRANQFQNKPDDLDEKLRTWFFAERAKGKANEAAAHTLYMQFGYQTSIGSDAALYRNDISQARAFAARNMEEFNDLVGSIESSSPPPTANPTKEELAQRAKALEELSAQIQKNYPDPAKTLIRDTNPRVRLEAMRALARIPTVESAALVLEAAVNGGSAAALPAGPTGQFANSTAAADTDTHYAYAAWLSVNDLAPQVMEYVETIANGTGRVGVPPAGSGVSPEPSNNEKASPAKNAARDSQGPGGTPSPAGETPTLPAATRTAMITFALQSLPADKTGPLLSKIVAKNGVSADGPWIELIGQAGGAAECEKLLALIAQPRATAALIAAARRGVKPPGASLDVIKSAPAEVKADALRLAGLWKLDAVEHIAATMNGASQPVIDAAFDALATLRTPAAASTLEALLAKGDAGLRRRALEALAAFKPDSALAALSVVAADGDDAAKLALFRSLFQSETFKGKFVKAIPADLPKPAAAAALRAARELGRKGEALVAALTPIAGAPAPAANAGDIAAMVTNVQKNGNPVEGEAIYRRLALACTACHAIGGAGSKVGPDMTTIGASAPLDYLIESLYVPNAKVKEGYNAVALTLKGGRAASGVLLRETAEAVFLRDAAGNESSVPKADITARENVGSIMPAGLLNTLTDREKAHMFAFLSQLGKPGPFDATKASIARVWWLYPGKDVEAIVSGKLPAYGAKTLTYVDGRLPKAALTEALQMVPDPGDTIVAVAKFSGSGKTRLNLQGVTKAWLDGAPLAIASNPSPEVELTAGNHTLVVKLDTKQLPENLRADCPEGRFATE